MSNIKELENIPDISFIDNMTLQETDDLARQTYIQVYRDLFDEEPVLGNADIETLLMKAFTLIAYQVMQYIEAKGRAELLKSSTGSALDALGANSGVTRSQSTKATATERFFTAGAHSNPVAVPAGTRVKTAAGRYFNTLDYAEIEPGSTYVDVIIQAEIAGSDSNNLDVGTIDLLVDAIPYISAVSNIDKSVGGLDVQSDYGLTEQIYFSPSRYSCAGPLDAYEYYVRKWRSDVSDVVVLTPSPCVVSIYFTVQDQGTSVPRVPTSAEIQQLTAFLSGKTLRPATDFVTCHAPTEVPYTIDLTYWIAASDQSKVGKIQADVSAAVAEYQAWQRTLGRDINPTELIYRIRAAGAKRVSISDPDDIQIQDVELPYCSGLPVVTYGGLEND